jgi:Ulp1 family protease
VPIEEVLEGHWYLMVVHIEERRIYHVDSNLTDGNKGGRRLTIHKIVRNPKLNGI